MEPFPHLKFVQKIIGDARLFGGGGPNETSEANRNDRQGHSSRLGGQASQIQNDWHRDFAGREQQELAPLDSDIVPVFLRINAEKIDADPDFNLAAFGIEIISQEDDGFIVGASVDNLRSLFDKINDFTSGTHGSGFIADLWEIINGDRKEWKPQHILSESLLAGWHEINDETIYKVEVGIAFDKPLGPEPDRTKRGGETRYRKYVEQANERDDRLFERENHFDEFINHYGRKTSDFVHLEDCFGCEVEISGKGLKDLVWNYPYVFEVNELDEITGVVGGNNALPEYDLELIPPSEDAPIIGIIDSGFMENHRYLEPAIDNGQSKSYIAGDDSTADMVAGGGHGTRVAGAVLYPLGLSKYSSPYTLPCFIRNLRVLDANNNLLHHYPAELIKKIVDGNPDCTIFNLSVTSTKPFRKKHMSTWAACIDQAIAEGNKLFVISAGNLYRDTVRHYITNGNPYPHFLQEPFCAIANPGQSCFALTVGSVNHISINDADWESLGNQMEVSTFSRIGPGIWNTIKPDVVEFGGGYVMSKNGNHLIRETQETSPELLRSTHDGGPAVGCDAVGTSFSAPKVTHIASRLQALYPGENVNLIRALIVQGARLPGEHLFNPTTEKIDHLGYGIPSLDRVTRNSEHRVTFYNTGLISATEGHLYSLKIPESLRSQGDEYDILLEVTLAFSSKVRRTRQKVKSYLGTWLTWDSAKIDENFADFQNYALKAIQGEETSYDKARRKQMKGIPWMLDVRSNRGEVPEYSRDKNTVQKDWAILKSYNFQDEIGFVVQGHKGWDKDNEPIPYALTVSLEILGQDIPIYEELRIENEIELEV